MSGQVCTLDYPLVNLEVSSVEVSSMKSICIVMGSTEGARA
jgi:hypothetical protein